MPRRRLGFLGELTLRTATSTAALLLLRTLTGQLLLLPRGELLQAFQRFICLLRAALLATALHLIVLVAHLVRLELQQIGKVRGVRATATTAATLLLHADLHFTERRLRLLEPLQRTLLRHQSFGRPALHQQLLRGEHFRTGLW